LNGVTKWNDVTLTNLTSEEIVNMSNGE